VALRRWYLVKPGAVTIATVILPRLMTHPRGVSCRTASNREVSHMPVVKVTSGTLTVESVGGGSIDNTLPGGGHIDNSLPPGWPPIGSTLPEPPPGVWPPLSPWAPIQPAPPGTPPGTIWPPIGRPVDPGYGRPGVGAGHPDAGLPPSPGHPDAGLPPAPARPDAGLPPSPGHPSGGPIAPPPGSTLPVPKTWWLVAGIPGIGFRYVAIDPSLTVGYPLPPAPEPK
jgi:hypothetical protein